MVEAKKYGDYMAEVIGEDSRGNPVNFRLRVEEIKHIRRCASMYDRIFDRAYDVKLDKSLTKRIYYKFAKFGKIKRGISAKKKKAKLKGIEIKCSHPDCKETESITIDHIKRKSSGENPHRKENLRLLCPKHHLLRELKTNLFHKGIEIKKLQQRIRDIEKRGTTDCLGYKVLSKDKFENLDE